MEVASYATSLTNSTTTAASSTSTRDFYAPKPVPYHLQPLLKACVDGNVDALRGAWSPTLAALFSRLHRDETCHPLLTAAHHLRVEAVDFLLQQGLNPKQRGTVHPYTGDNMIVSECQGISPCELISKMLFMHPRKSKRREAILAVRDLLAAADTRPAVTQDAAAVTEAQFEAWYSGAGSDAGAVATAMHVTPALTRYPNRGSDADAAAVAVEATPAGGMNKGGSGATATATPVSDAAAFTSPALPRAPPVPAAEATQRITARSTAVRSMPDAETGGAATPTAAAAAGMKRRADTSPPTGTRVKKRRDEDVDVVEEEEGDFAAGEEVLNPRKKSVAAPPSAVLESGPAVYATSHSAPVRVLSVSSMEGLLLAALNASIPALLRASLMPGVLDDLTCFRTIVCVTIGVPPAVRMPSHIADDLLVSAVSFSGLEDLLRCSGEALEGGEMARAVGEYMQLLRTRWQAVPSDSRLPGDVERSAKVLLTLASTHASELQSPDAGARTSSFTRLDAPPLQPFGISPHLRTQAGGATVPTQLPPAPPSASSAMTPSSASTPFSGRKPVSCVVLGGVDAAALPSLHAFTTASRVFAPMLPPRTSPAASSGAQYMHSVTYQYTSTPPAPGSVSDGEQLEIAASAAADAHVTREAVQPRVRDGFALLAMKLKAVLAALVLDTWVHVCIPVLRGHSTAQAADASTARDAAGLLWCATLTQSMLSVTSGGSGSNLSSALGHRFAIDAVRCDEYRATAPASARHDAVLITLRVKRLA